MTTTTAAPAARRSIAEGRAELQDQQAALAALDRERLEIEEKQRDARPSSLNEQKALEQRRLDVTRRANVLREAVNRRRTALTSRALMPERPEEIRGARLDQLEDWLEVARDNREAVGQKLATQNAGRSRLLERSGTIDALKRHDEVQADLALEFERAIAAETRLEQVLTAARDAWPGLEAAFEADLAEAKKLQGEGLRLLREYLEKTGPRIAEILERQQVIDQWLAGLRERARYLGREDDVPASPNQVLRPRQLPLYATGGHSPEVHLPGGPDGAIWPRPRSNARPAASTREDKS